MVEYTPELNILIVEDDDGAAHLIKTNLKRTGICAGFIRAKDGEEAMKFLTDPSSAPKPFSYRDKLVVLLDLRMPRADGAQVLKFIKTSDKLAKIPVIMFTTSNRPAEVKRCYELGCNFYIKKEVDYKKFSEKISILSSFIQSAEIPVLENVEDV